MQVLIHGSNRLQFFVFELAKSVNGPEVDEQEQSVPQFVSLYPLLRNFVPVCPIVSNSVEKLSFAVLDQGLAEFLTLLANDQDSS